MKAFFTALACLMGLMVAASSRAYLDAGKILQGGKI